MTGLRLMRMTPTFGSRLLQKGVLISMARCQVIVTLGFEGGEFHFHISRPGYAGVSCDDDNLTYLTGELRNELRAILMEAERRERAGVKGS